MGIEDFIYEEIKDCDLDFDFYIVYIQHECDDPYYPPYKDSIGIYKSKENAIKRARESFYKTAKGYTTAEDRKYGGVNVMLYIEGDYFKDSENEGECDKGSENEGGCDENTIDNGEKKNGHKYKRVERQVYIIYDKEEQERIDTRWRKMHNMDVIG